MADESQLKRSLEESNATERTSKRPCYREDTIISILVGPDEKRFAVHKDVICAKSKFFRAACSTCWLEGQERTVRLPDVKPEIFQVYIDWAYTSVLAEQHVQVSEATERTSCRGLVDLYLLGDALDDVKLRNQVIKRLSSYAVIAKQPGPKTLHLIWENTPANSILRKWTVDITILKLKREDFVKSATSYPM